jgi:hypothetical protein
MHIVAAIFFRQDLAISRHKHRYGIRQQQNSRGQSTRPTVGSRKAHASILQIDSIHEVMQRDVRVAAIQPRQQRCHQARESNYWVVAERAEQQIEPHDVGFQFADGLDDAAHAPGIIKRPAALHGELRQFRLPAVNFIGEDGKA